MGKYCSYKGCRTGRDADRAKCKRLGVRQLSVFKVPKNMLKRWSEAIGQCLSQSDSVCELHFADDVIIKEDRIQMADGTLEVIPRIRHSLVAGAVPVTAHSQEDVDSSKKNNSTNAIPEPSGKSAVVCENRVTHTPTTSRNVILEEVTTQDSEVVDLEDRTTDFTDHLLESNSETSSTYSESVDGVQDTSFGFTSDIEGCSSNSISSDDREGEGNSLGQFTIDDVFAHLKGSYLPESWSWITNPREKSSTMYVHIDRQTLQIRLYLIVHKDLSVTVQTPDSDVTIGLDRVVTSIESLTELLQEVENKIVCCGSGFDQERRAANCAGFVPNSDYTISVQLPRCTACRQLRKKLQTRENRHTTSMPVQRARVQHSSHLNQRNYRSLVEKIQNLKREVRRVQDKCLTITDAALNETISELPPVQQEAVRACLNAAKVERSRL